MIISLYVMIYMAIMTIFFVISLFKDAKIQNKWLFGYLTLMPISLVLMSMGFIVGLYLFYIWGVLFILSSMVMFYDKLYLKNTTHDKYFIITVILVIITFIGIITTI